MLGSTLAGVNSTGPKPSPGSQPEEEVSKQRNLSDLAHCIVAGNIHPDVGAVRRDSETSNETDGLCDSIHRRRTTR